MGLDSRLIAIGHFSYDLINCMEYPKDYYAEVKEGTTVITSLFYCNTSGSSRDLANALDIDV